MLLTRFNDGQEGVACWTYDFFEVSLHGFSQEVVSEKLEWLQIVLSSLAKFELFIPTELKLLMGKDREEVKITITDYIGDRYDIKEIVNSCLIDDKYLLRVSCYGKTIIVDGNKKNEVSGAIVVTLGMDVLNIITDSDVWLPYDLFGNEQKELFSQNAPRLKEALGEIEAKIGVDFLYEHSKYAYVDKFDLRNVMNEDGTPMNLISI